MLEKVTREYEVYGSVGEEIEVCGRPYEGFHARVEERSESRPEIDRDPPLCDHGVNKISMTASEIEYTVIRRYKLTEMKSPKRIPQNASTPVRRESSLVICTHAHGPVALQPKTSPRIMRMPTLNARRLLTLPPLLIPTRR